MHDKEIAKKILIELIEGDEPLIVLGSAGPKGVTMMRGDTRTLKAQIAAGMSRSDEIMRIFRDGTAMFMLKDIIEKVDDKLDDNDLKLDCEKCEKKDDCPVKGELEAYAHEFGESDATKDLIKKLLNCGNQ